MADSENGLLVCWLAGWFVGLLVCWFVGRLVCWLADVMRSAVDYRRTDYTACGLGWQTLAETLTPLRESAIFDV